MSALFIGLSVLSDSYYCRYKYGSAPTRESVLYLFILFIIFSPPRMGATSQARVDIWRTVRVPPSVFLLSSLMRSTDADARLEETY
jgi:hypothetical protein